MDLTCWNEALYLADFILYVSLSSSGSSDTTKDVSTNHAGSYFLKRENELSVRKRAEQETANNDYEKAGLVCVVLGWNWNRFFPVSKL